MEVLKGYLVRMIDNGNRAQVQVKTGKIIDDVLMLYPYGFFSNMQNNVSTGSLILLILPSGSSNNAFGFPYNPTLQPTDVQSNEVAIGNFKNNTNKITFKNNGDIEVECSSNVTIEGAQINLADANSLVLNQNASLSVTIPSGSSAGTYPVTINSSGQSKVFA